MRTRTPGICISMDDTNTSGEQLYNSEKSRSSARNYLTKYQNGNTSEWDCITLFDAILQSNSIAKMNFNPIIKTEVDNLRMIRNSAMHVASARLTYVEFRNRVTRVKNSFQILSLSTNELQQIATEKNPYQSFQARPPRSMHDDAEVPRKRRITEHGHNKTINALEAKQTKSIKHREKIQSLKSINDENLAKVKPPLQYCSFDEKTRLGSGSNETSVYIAIMEDESEVAVKRMLTQSAKDAAQNEKEILSLIDTKKSPFVVSYRHFFRDDTFMYLILELCEETLREFVPFQSSEYLQQHGPTMIKEILTGLEFLHQQKILHRDLKPSNILVDLDGRMRLADFGISRVLNEDETTRKTDPHGTDGWMSAVIVAIKQKIAARYKKKSDVQVVGLIAFFILTKGEHPFGDFTHEKMLNIENGNPVNLAKLDYPGAQQFISWLINDKLEDRPYAYEALKHSFLDGVELHLNQE